MLAGAPPQAMAQAAGTTTHVLKDPDCGCCSAWIDILESDGFVITTEASADARLLRYKSDNRIPAEMAACHTARVEGYLIEGHVPTADMRPPADMRRRLEERRDAIGLAVPGMPYGSPGMGSETERDAYDVFVITRDGSTTVFSHYAAA